MKRITFILLLISTVAFSQKKKEYFLDENWKMISKELFLKKIDHRVNLDHYTENDTAIFGKLHTRAFYKKLAPAKLDALRKNIEEMTGKAPDTSKIILVNYWSGLDHVHHSAYTPGEWKYVHKRYLKKLNKIADTEQYWIYKDEASLVSIEHGRELWKQERSAYFTDNFFPYHFNYGSIVIIHPSGNYYVYYGEHGHDEIFNGLKGLIEKHGI